MRSNLKALQIPGRKKIYYVSMYFIDFFYPPGNSEISWWKLRTIKYITQFVMYPKSSGIVVRSRKGTNDSRLEFILSESCYQFLSLIFLIFFFLLIVKVIHVHRKKKKGNTRIMKKIKTYWYHLEFKVYSSKNIFHRNVKE